jgi:hypothetical protein
MSDRMMKNEEKKKENERKRKIMTVQEIQINNYIDKKNRAKR